MPKPGIIPKHTIFADGAEVKASAPAVISASRATDIPAFYGEWFHDQLKKGFVKRRNPFSGKEYFISLQNASAFVFWSKNPEPFYSYLTTFHHDFYMQFTLNYYDGTGLEPNVPDVDTRINTFKNFARSFGKNRILWRFDPLLITPGMAVKDLLERIDYVSQKLQGYTTRLTFSFITLSQYKAARNRLLKTFPELKGDAEMVIPRPKEKQEILKYLSYLQKKWQKIEPEFSIQTCALPNDYSNYGFKPARCIDDALLSALFPNNQKLMEFLGTDSLFAIQNSLPDDKSQRKHCHCIPSKDIGAYNTCKHDCLYCYANKI